MTPHDALFCKQQASTVRAVPTSPASAPTFCGAAVDAHVHCVSVSAAPPTAAAPLRMLSERKLLAAVTVVPLSIAETPVYDAARVQSATSAAAPPCA